MNYRYYFLLLLMISNQLVFGQLENKQTLRFKTANGHIIKVFKGVITYDNRTLLKMKYDDILYEEHSNRLIEDHGSIFLFLAIGGSPNRDRSNVFQITSSSAKLITDAILSPVKDYDGDGYYEFGGTDFTEMHPNLDSMYYIPSAYYEIRKGKIRPDIPLTKSKDIAMNGLYLAPNHQLNKNGFCCKVILIPGKKPK